MIINEQCKHITKQQMNNIKRLRLQFIWDTFHDKAFRLCEVDRTPRLRLYNEYKEICNIYDINYIPFYDGQMLKKWGALIKINDTQYILNERYFNEQVFSQA